MNVIIASVVLWIASSGAALACGLDDCALADVDHLEGWRQDRIPADDFAWMNHDLALARAFLADGDDAKARQIVAGLDYALRLRAEEMVAARGRSRVAAFHRALRALQLDAGGPALARLDLRRAGAGGGGEGSGGVAAVRAEDDGSSDEEREDAAEEARRELRERERRDESARPQELPDREPPGGPMPRW